MNNQNLNGIANTMNFTYKNQNKIKLRKQQLKQSLKITSPIDYKKPSIF